jgi:hypothetical protein
VNTTLITTSTSHPITPITHVAHALNVRDPTSFLQSLKLKKKTSNPSLTLWNA